MDKQSFLRHFLLQKTVAAQEPELVRQHENRTFRPAAVLIGLVERPQGLQVILTKRASHLKHHPGQVSFPGGKLEKEDDSLYAAAIREAWEEIGLCSDKIRPLGQLPPLNTVSQFEVTPVLGLIDPDYALTLDHNEVESAFEVPVGFLLNPLNIHSLHFPYKNVLHNVFAVPYGKHLIWGVTAQIIHALQLQITNQIHAND